MFILLKIIKFIAVNKLIYYGLKNILMSKNTKLYFIISNSLIGKIFYSFMNAEFILRMNKINIAINISVVSMF